MVSPTAATINVYKSFWSVLRSQALETPVEPDLALHQSLPEPSPEPSPEKPPRPSPEPSPEPCCTWPGSASKPPRPSPEPSSEPCWTWPGFPPKRLGTISGTFFGTLLKLTWLCTKASQAFTGTFSETLLNLTWLCTKASHTFTGTVSGTLLNLTWPPGPSPEPSPEPCWTWHGFAPKPQTLTGTFGTFSGTSLNLTRRLHQSTPELFRAEDPISLRCWGKIWRVEFWTLSTLFWHVDPWLEGGSNIESGMIFIQQKIWGFHGWRTGIWVVISLRRGEIQYFWIVMVPNRFCWAGGWYFSRLRKWPIQGQILANKICDQINRTALKSQFSSYQSCFQQRWPNLSSWYPFERLLALDSAEVEGWWWFWMGKPFMVPWCCGAPMTQIGGGKNMAGHFLGWLHNRSTLN